MAGKKSPQDSYTKRPIEAYQHTEHKRLNNPPVGLVTPETDPDIGKKTYRYDYHLDPQLNFDARKIRDDLAKVIDEGLAAETLEEAKAALAKLHKAQEPYLDWAGKAERTSFEVPTVSLHVHERIEPRTILEAVRKSNGEQPRQMSLFEQEEKPLREAIEFYRHKEGWTNRLIAGDSLLVMNSLLEKEGMAGKVQMIYIDPPYGIKYGSNFQPFVNKRDVKDGKDEDLTSEPEQLRAFRDTWELGIHSYLTYLRDRLLLARELLTSSGSIFVQISDENFHHVRELMDEVFGTRNFISKIVFYTRSNTQAVNEPIADNLLWYSKDRNMLKLNPLYIEKASKTLDVRYRYIETPDGNVRTMTSEELSETTPLPEGVRRFSISMLSSKSGGDSAYFGYEYRGEIFYPQSGRFWSTTKAGITNIIKANRIYVEGKNLKYKLYLDDFCLTSLPNIWNDTVRIHEGNIYAVQTATKVIQRCILMTTDPGDLIFDPTCGSGTTAYVAEKWGRRWITCDTSRVALAIARQRLMTAVFDYYELAHPEEGVSSGFKYKTVSHVTLKSIANNPEIDGIHARMHPAIEQALSDLNAALRGHDKPFTVTQGGRAGQKVDFRAPESAIVKLPSGQEVSAGALLEWEVPFAFPDDWPEKARQPFEAFHAARRAMQQKMDEAIARHAPYETLYDQPLVDRKKVRVTGPFTVEAVPAPAVKSIEEFLEGRPPADDGTVARSGETLRQAEWRDELLKTGIRGKNGQYICFARLEPLPGCRWLHAEGETRPSDEGADTVREAAPAYHPVRVVVSFGPEHGLLEQRQVALALEEAQQLVPRPKLVIFAAFQFDPEAAKDIDEMNWPGVTLLKAKINEDLLTEDLKKKRASNESFWLIGQPDITVERIEPFA
ncbi:MAG: site-specific DNA-methyltransferase [Firmicutes bacterium]|nr:site-specific DNA-methyltransferase [Bacillota bacterium]